MLLKGTLHRHRALLAISSFSRCKAMELPSSSLSSASSSSLCEAMAPPSSSSPTSSLCRAVMPPSSSSSSSPSSSTVSHCMQQEGHLPENLSWKESLAVLGHPPTPPTFAFFLQSCMVDTALAYGRLIHELIIICGFNDIPLLQHLLLQMYSHCAAVEDTFKLYLSMDQKGVTSWNIIIKALTMQGHVQEAYCLYYRMQEEGVIPDRSTCVLLIPVLDGHENMLKGKQIHVLAIEIGCESDVVVGTALVKMYSKCIGLADSWAAFNAMPSRNVVTWTTMISVCAQHGEGREAFQLFEKMLQGSVNPDRVTLINILAACAGSFLLAEGQQVHAWVLCYGLEQHVSIVNALINLYDKCGMLGEAELTFDSVEERDIISFSLLISAYAGHGNMRKALSLLDQMELAGFASKKVTLVSVLSAFAGQGALSAGEGIHNCIIERGFDGDILICNALINLYHKCGCAESARTTFEKMPDRNVISWTSIIGMHAQKGQCKEVFVAFEHMQREGLMPNRVTFASLLEFCTSQVALAEGRCVHVCIVGSSIESDIVVGTGLVKFYGLCGSFKDVWVVFERIVEKDVLSWNTIISVCVDLGYGRQALYLFDLMLAKGILPDNATYGLLLVACSKEGFLYHGIQVYARAGGNATEMNVVTATNVVNMYGKCGRPYCSHRLFDKMFTRNVISWTSMIASYTENGLDNLALQLFLQMLQECILPNMITLISVITLCANQLDLIGGRRLHTYVNNSEFRSETALGNALINMYGKCASLKHARQTFDSMPERNVVSWSGMIAAYAQHSHGMAALQLFEEMQLIEVLPNDITLVSVLDACANQTSLAAGECLHAFLLNKTFELSVLVANSMINMYNKCGNIWDAWKTFVCMTERDTTTWSVMIGAFAEHGQNTQAVQLTEQMTQEGSVPDEATIINFLSSCSHCGQLDVGLHFFTSMTQGFRVTPDHCACLIDLFGRAGLLETAEVLIHFIPVQPTLMSFMALLGACRYQGDMIRGECMARHVHELDSKSTAPFYMLNHIYSVADDGA